MRPDSSNPSRRLFLLRSAKAAGLTALTLAMCRGTAVAGKAAKDDVIYQDSGRNGNSCAQCRFFSPDKQNPNDGTCLLVAGLISREGWCAVFSPKAADQH